MSKVCRNSFAVAYNNKAYALFQVGDYAKISVCTTKRPCDSGPQREQVTFEQNKTINENTCKNV